MFSTQDKLFDKILIANRGEIACRVIKTCKKLGIKSVAIYSEPDVNSLHVQMADEAVCVGPAASAESYLNIQNILKAIEETGAQAVHPGYGFLSENYIFAEALAEKGVAFIGPGKRAIVDMGDKIASKKIAKEAQVNTIPGYLGAVETNEEILRVANEIGYPVMIKASAGGGGKGMRVAWNDDEAIDGFRLSRQEAISSFGDDTIFIEKFVESPRHIEIQVLCDGHGNSVWVNERECSIQRRNQKVIEEAPSVFLDEATRKAMGEQAVALAQAVDYRSAGTVEFIVNPQREFFFLEMNTRLQVEHPVTEYITGIDLVEQMIRVAAGHPLSLTQADIGIKGWSVESRVYAEDPLKDFLPSIGTLSRYEEPGKGDENVRVDTGVQEGAEISIYYDPLISKLITYGPNRKEAIDKMREALDSYVIRGVSSNINFLRSLMDHPRFLEGEIDTKFIEEEFPDGFQGHINSPSDLQALAVGATVVYRGVLDSQVSLAGQRDDFDRENFISKQLSSLVVSIPDAKGDMAKIHVKSTTEGNKLHVVLTSEGEAPREVVVDTDYQRGAASFTATLNGEEKHVFQALVSDASKIYTVRMKGTDYKVRVLSEEEERLYNFMPIPEIVDTSRMIMSPMPGAVFSVNVEVGDEVFPGQELCVIEAMKMQNAIRAEKAAKVAAVNVVPGQKVQADEVLIQFE